MKMAKVFNSHASKDKEFVRKLSNDLAQLGHDPWLDDWEITVGECIVSKVEQGIEESDYVILVLSENAVKSGWVEREWKSKYWDEINNGKALILPVLICDCNIPTLLKTKKYADFRNGRNYAVALVELATAITNNTRNSMVSNEKEAQIKNHGIQSANLIAKFQSRSIPLSQCVAETYSLAKRINNKELIALCEGELTGWSAQHRKRINPTHRLVRVYTSFGKEINMQYFGWGQNSSSILSYLRDNPEEFKEMKMIFSQSIAKLEAETPTAYSPNNILSI